MSDFPQSERDIAEIGRRRELPPDEPYGGGDEPSECDDGCEASQKRIVKVYRERREVCGTCGRVLRTWIAP